jgi:hypothetical protein
MSNIIKDKIPAIKVKPDKIRLLTLLEEIASGSIKIPVFQREFVWKRNQIRDLFDSIARGYPIGSLLFWKPEGKYKTKREIGPYKIEEEKEDTSYVLDGFQRITTLFSALTNPKKFDLEESSKEIQDYLIYYNLDEGEFTFLKSKKDKKSYLIPLYMLADVYDSGEFIGDIDKEILDKSENAKLKENARRLTKILYEYEIPFVEIKGGDIRSAVEIFSRTNSTGMEISEDFMLSALSYNIETGFLLSDSITEFINSLNNFNFDKLKRDTILNCISNSTKRIFFDVKIEDLLDERRVNLENLTNNAYIHIIKAVKFLYNKLYVFDVSLLPYPAQLVFISEFYRIKPQPTPDDEKALEKWFWTTTYSNYFTLYSLSQQRSAYRVFCDFSVGKSWDGIFKLDNDTRFSTVKYPDKINFTGVRPKALQLFYLKMICENQEIQERESVKEIFISNSAKKDRSAANMIFRLSSEFDSDKDKKQTDIFIRTSDFNVLKKHFITPEMVELYKQNKIDEFLFKREELIKKKEAEFVKELDIKYTP